jgi:hypothetical protein
MAYDTGRITNPSGSGVWTYAQLVASNPGNPPPVGTTAYTSDQGMCTWNGYSWAGASNRKVVTKLRAGIAQALTSNPATAQPLIQPLAHPGDAAAVTKGTSFSNGGNNYTCIVAGTTGVGTKPSATTTGALVDGTVQWYYMGPTFTSNANAPTFTNVVAASKYTGTYWANTANNRGDGTVQVLDDSNFLVTGGPVTATGTNNSWISTVTSSVAFSVSFMTDAQSFQIETTGTGNTVFSIYVNSVPLTLGYGSLATNGQSVNYAQLVFPTKAVRLFTVEINAGSAFWGVLSNDKTSKVWAPYLSNSVRGVVTGSSFISGSSQHPVTPSLAWGGLMFKLMNMVDYWQDNQGSGTGWVAAGATSAFGGAARLAAVVAYNPELLIFAGGGINDSVATIGGTVITTAQEQAAIVTTLQAYRAALPSTLILVIGAESGAKGPTAAIFNMELAASQAITQLGDPNIFFIPQCYTTAAKAWVSGTGTTAATNTSGNSDIYIGADTTHPVQAGVFYYSQQSANGIINVINQMAYP